MKRILCLFGWHDWHIAEERWVEGTGYTEDPGDYEPGGTDYHLLCPRCGMFRVIRKRGAWVPPNYPPLTPQCPRPVNSRPGPVAAADCIAVGECGCDLRSGGQSPHSSSGATG